MSLITLNNKTLLINSKGLIYTFPLLDKDTLITMNLDGTDRQYRVLKNVGSGVHEVLTMWGLSKSFAFDSNDTNTYAIRVALQIDLSKILYVINS